MRLQKLNETDALVHPGISLLRLMGIPAGRLNVGLALGASGTQVSFGFLGFTKGVADIIGCIPGPGRLCGFEAKLPGKNFTRSKQWEAQWEFLSYVIAIGGAACVFTSLPELQEYATAALAGATFEVTRDGVVKTSPGAPLGKVSPGPAKEPSPEKSPVHSIQASPGNRTSGDEGPRTAPAQRALTQRKEPRCEDPETPLPRRPEGTAEPLPVLRVSD